MSRADGVQRYALRHARLFVAIALACAVARSGPIDAAPANAMDAGLGEKPSSARQRPAGIGRFVTTCDDTNEPGSLRYEIAHDVENDSIILDGLACRIIFLEMGEIVIPQNSFMVARWTPGRVQINAQGKGRVFNHTGNGRLSLMGLDLRNGLVSTTDTPAEGGCVRSAGSISLEQSSISGCGAFSTRNGARGGAIFAYAMDGNGSSVGSSMAKGLFARGGAVNVAGYVRFFGQMSITAATAVSSATDTVGSARGGGIYAQSISNYYDLRIADNRAVADSGVAEGGGLFVTDRADLHHATITGNSTASLQSAGGGLVVRGRVGLDSTLIAANQAGASSGARFDLTGIDFDDVATIVNSTISGNVSTAGAAAVVSAKTTSVYNSTIAFNTAHDSDAGLHCDGAALIESTIIANNASFGGAHEDLVANAALSGSHDLIVASQANLPVDTLRSDPQLLPLSYNGGYNFTHALLPTSPAIDAGSNLLELLYDQRGYEGFDRVIPRNADIGAFELDYVGLIFRAGFEFRFGID